MKQITLMCVAFPLVLATTLVVAATRIINGPVTTPSPRFAILTSQSEFQSQNGGDASRIVDSPPDSDPPTLDAINALGIRYAGGRGVAKDNGLAPKMFTLLAAEG